MPLIRTCPSSSPPFLHQFFLSTTRNPSKTKLRFLLPSISCSSVSNRLHGQAKASQNRTSGGAHFCFETTRQNSCTIRLSNNSRVDHVAFKVMTTNPEKYRVIPKTGLILPGSSRDVKVTMRDPEEAPSDVECKDRFLIKSVAVSPDDTAESSQKLFKEEGHIVQSCKLRVVYEFPSDIESSLNGIERHSRDGMNAGDFFKRRVIAVVLMCLICGSLMPLLWSLSALTMMLAVKLLWKLVSDSVEDWIVSTIFELFVRGYQLFSDVTKSRSNN